MPIKIFILSAQKNSARISLLLVTVKTMLAPAHASGIAPQARKNLPLRHLTATTNAIRTQSGFINPIDQTYHQRLASTSFAIESSLGSVLPTSEIRKL
jgi:hypothetical protein